DLKILRWLVMFNIFSLSYFLIVDSLYRILKDPPHQTPQAIPVQKFRTIWEYPQGLYHNL
ncbi:MAG: hypothetical protein ACP5HI_08120, partial [Caldimicrobium sp.]